MTRLPDSFLRAPLAHRAYHDVTQGRPENSRAAIQAAIDKGYGIEIDVQPSADGQAMVFHDYDLGRLTGQNGAIHLQSAQSLGGIQLLSGDEGIPTLAEVLDLVAGRVPLLVEIKDQDGQMVDTVGPLEAATAQALDGYEGPLAVMSFNPHAALAFHRLRPDLPVGLVTSAYHAEDWPLLKRPRADHLARIADFDHNVFSFISHEAPDLSSPRVADLKSEGAAILCWTIRSEAEEQQARRVAENITFEGYEARLDA